MEKKSRQSQPKSLPPPAKLQRPKSKLPPRSHASRHRPQNGAAGVAGGFRAPVPAPYRIRSLSTLSSSSFESSSSFSDTSSSYTSHGSSSRSSSLSPPRRPKGQRHHNQHSGHHRRSSKRRDIKKDENKITISPVKKDPISSSGNNNGLTIRTADLVSSMTCLMPRNAGIAASSASRTRCNTAPGRRKSKKPRGSCSICKALPNGPRTCSDDQRCAAAQAGGRGARDSSIACSGECPPPVSTSKRRAPIFSVSPAIRRR